MDSGQEQRHSGPSSTLAELHNRLDTLWISYLRNLDEYTTTQKTLQDRLRSGFFSLSRANFNARPGMRYGGDYFHDRALATRRVTIERYHEDENNDTLKFAIIQHSVVADGDGPESKAETATAGEGLQQPSPPATPGPMDEKTNKSTEGKESRSDKMQEIRKDDSARAAKPKLPLEADPLCWFGILVPQELRSVQASFSAAMDDDIGQAVNAGRAMRENEVEIRKLRKEIRRAQKAEKS